MAKLIAIASSDWHIHRWKNFNEHEQRLFHCLEAMEYIAMVCDEAKVPLLFCGDWFHTPKDVENRTAGKTMKTYYKHFEKKDVNVFAISGNHDMSEKNALGHVSPSYLDLYTHLKTFRKLDFKTMAWTNFSVQGVPYMNNDQDMIKAVDELRNAKHLVPGPRILLLHSDCPGAQTPEGFEVKETEHIPWNLDEFFKEWDLVLFGHIHKPQKLSNKCYMLGSPIHQTRGDEGTNMGYWEIYDEGEPKFIHLHIFPKFITLEKGVELPDKFNYYSYPDEILADENVVAGDFNITKSRAKLAAQYCKVKGVKGKSKREALISILNEAE